MGIVLNDTLPYKHRMPAFRQQTKFITQERNIMPRDKESESGIKEAKVFGEPPFVLHRVENDGGRRICFGP